MQIIVRVGHIRKAMLCMAGARDWFASYDLSWQEFVVNGLPVEQLEALGDAFADRVCAIARSEADHGR